MSEFDEVGAELAVIDANTSLTPGDILTPGAGFMSTMPLDTPAEKVVAMNVLSSPLSLSEHEGVAIVLKGIMAQKTKFRDNKKGELTDGIACYLVDKDDQSYISVSSGISTAVMQFVGVFGNDPSAWPDGITLTPTKKNIGNGKTTWTVATSVTPTKGK